MSILGNQARAARNADIADNVKDDCKHQGVDLVTFSDFKIGQHSRRRWWVQLRHIAAARLQTESVRGHDGRAAVTDVLTLYLPAATPAGETMAIKVYGDEATAIAARLDQVVPFTADAA